MNQEVGSRYGKSPRALYLSFNYRPKKKVMGGGEGGRGSDVREIDPLFPLTVIILVLTPGSARDGLGRATSPAESWGGLGQGLVE